MIGTATIGYSIFTGGTQSIITRVFKITRYVNFGLPSSLFGMTGSVLLPTTCFVDDVAPALHVGYRGVVAMTWGLVLARGGCVLFVD